MHTERVVQFARERAIVFMNVRIPDTYQGKDATGRLAERIKRDGIKKLLIVCDKTIIKFNLLDRFMDELRSEGIDAFIYDEVIPNPEIETVEAGVRSYNHNECEGIVAIGGGSSMDTGKLVAARIGNPNTPVSRMHGNLKVRKKLVPFYAIPTTAGTGSEATLAAVVVESETHHKYSVNDPKLVPLACALDPGLTVSLPKSITGQTGLDALTHAVEAYTNMYGLNKAYSYGKNATAIILNNLEAAYDDGTDTVAREKMLTGAFRAGAAFTRNCVGYVHAIGHHLSGFYGLPHGLVMAALLPIILRKYGDTIQKPLAELYDVVANYQDTSRRGKESLIVAAGNFPPGKKAELFIEEIERLNEKFGIEAHFDCIQSKDISRMVDYAFEEVKTYPTPMIFSKKEIEEIYRSIM